MEYKLGFIIARLQIPVPPDYATRPDKRTLSTYLDAITNAVDLYHKAGTCVLEPAQIAAVGHRPRQPKGCRLRYWDEAASSTAAN